MTSSWSIFIQLETFFVWHFFLLALTVLGKKRHNMNSAFIRHFSLAFRIHKTISKCIVVAENWTTFPALICTYFGAEFFKCDAANARVKVSGSGLFQRVCRVYAASYNENRLYKYRVYLKCYDRLQELSSPRQKKEKISYWCMSANKFFEVQSNTFLPTSVLHLR